MLRTSFLAAAASALFATMASAQFCSDNLYPARLVDQNGVELPKVTLADGAPQYVASSEAVYLAFNPTLPSGTYYVFVTNAPADGLLEMLSTNDPMDRFVSVQNDGGVLTLSLPFADEATPDRFGIGLGGQGMSLRLSPFTASATSQCRFNVLFGDTWDLTYGYDHPYLLVGGLQQNGVCPVRTYHQFRIGDGFGSDVTGSVFVDQNHNSVRDGNEVGFAGQQVRLVDADGSITTTTDAAGEYRFANVAAGSYTVEFVVPPTHVVNNTASVAIEVCDCADVPVQAFSAAPVALPCNARTVAYWRNSNGAQKIQQYNLLPTLPVLNIVNTFGCYVAPSNVLGLRLYLLLANGWNQGYELSAQLVAMHCNVAVGFVHPQCVLQDPQLGLMTVAQLLQQSAAFLDAHPYTPPCTFHRLQASRLTAALARANNNLTWQ